MKRRLAWILFAVLLGSARADDAQPAVRAALVADPARQGYAVDQPAILIRQRLFGLAHGLSLLAAACLDLETYSGSIQEAYAAWRARQGKTMEILMKDLAGYYFGSRAGEAEWPDLVRALGLKDSIQPSLGEVSLEDACASLPTAIIRPRYELDRLLAEAAAKEVEPTSAAASAATAPTPSAPATLAVPPAPTLEKPAE